MKTWTFLLPLAAVANSQVAQHPITPAKALTLDGIPQLGFGTWNLKEANTSDAVSWAIQAGYRHIDCAAAYDNEEAVGRGILDGLDKTGLKREDIWVTSKLWNDHHAPELVEEAVVLSITKLGIGYLDLYHMHWPVASASSGNSIGYLDTWEAMTKLTDAGRARYIGISNFSPEQLENLLNHTDTVPAVHQMELHPYLQQNEWIALHKQHGIHVTGYSPLAGSNPTYDNSGPPVPLLQNDVLAKIAKKRSCTLAQVALAWGLSRGTSIIPKSIHKDRITENYDSQACKLKEEDIKKIDALGRFHHRYNSPGKSWGVPLYEGLEDATGKHDRARFGDK